MRRVIYKRATALLEATVPNLKVLSSYMELVDTTDVTYRLRSIVRCGNRNSIFSVYIGQHTHILTNDLNIDNEDEDDIFTAYKSDLLEILNNTN